MTSDNTAGKKLFVARDVLAAHYVVHPNRPGEKAVGVLVQDREGTDALWAMEEDSVPDLIAILSGGLSADSKQILNELSKTDIVTSWSHDEDEESGRSTVHLVLYGKVECIIPEDQADSAIQMLDRVLHAQGHRQLGD